MNIKKKRHLQMAGKTREVYRWFDGVVEARKPDNISCRKGCSACCYQFVGLTMPEASAILVAHEKLVEELLPRLEADAEQLDKILRKHGIDPQDTVEITIGKYKDVVCDDWWEMFQPCPFLDTKSHLCRIYESRPAACRAYFVTSDPGLCEAEQGTKVNVWAIAQEQLAIGLALAEGTGTVHMGPLADVLLQARREFRK